MVTGISQQGPKIGFLSSNKDFFKFKCLSLHELRETESNGCKMIYERLGRHCNRNRSFNTRQKLKASLSLPENSLNPYHVVILGELNVGKSALCRSFFRSGLSCISRKSHFSVDDYEDELFDEASSDFAKHHHIFERPIVVNGVGHRIRILDVNTEKQLLDSDGVDGIGDVSQYLHIGDGCIVAYTCTDKSTFETAKEILSKITQMQTRCNRSFPVVLVGNKCDLARKRQVSTTEGIKVAEKFNVKFIETSAVLSENIEPLFQGIVEQIQLQKLIQDNSATLRKKDFYGSANSLLLKHKDLSKSLAAKCWRKINKKKENKCKRCLNFAVL